MKIHNGPQALGSSQPQSTARPRQRRHQERVDQVQVSVAAAEMNETRASKLDPLQAAIDAGTYSVSPDDLAKSIIADAIKR